MDATLTIDQAQIDALAARLTSIEGTMSEDEKLTLLTVFTLAAEALETRVAQEDVSGFALGGVRVAVGDVNGDLGAGLGNVFARKAGKGQQEYLQYEMKNVLITSYSMGA